ncbi:MAG: putative glycoside hydrolase [Bacillota bacterium]
MRKDRNILIVVSTLAVVLAIIIAVSLNINNNYSLNKENQYVKVESSPGVGTKNKGLISPQQSHQKSVGKDSLKESSYNRPKKKNDVKVKAIYITGSSAGNNKFLDRIIDLVKTTELNAVVIDVKEDGKVNYKSELGSVKEIGAYHQLYDVDHVVKRLHDNGIYVIGRVVCFRDNYLATKRVDLSIKRTDGTVWKENGKIAWANPYNKEVWRYNLDIAKEAIRKGFDEIQFDYVRFPTARKADVNYGENAPPKADAISGFLKESAAEINEMGVQLSADIFAIVCESSGDIEGIGQVLERVGMDIDCISPMIYPSHYANASRGMMGNGVGQSINGVIFRAPDLRPYEVVYNALLKTKDRITKVPGYKAKVRPYLQDFTATYLPKGYYQKYGTEQVRQQIKAVYDAGYEEWILWDAANTYTEAAFLKE